LRRSDGIDPIYCLQDSYFGRLQRRLKVRCRLPRSSRPRQTRPGGHLRETTSALSWQCADRARRRRPLSARSRACRARAVNQERTLPGHASDPTV